MSCTARNELAQWVRAVAATFGTAAVTCLALVTSSGLLLIGGAAVIIGMFVAAQFIQGASDGAL